MRMYDAEVLREAVLEFEPAAVIDQLTDLPDDMAKIPELAARNDRMLGEKTRNLLSAATAVSATRLVEPPLPDQPRTLLAEHGGNRK